MKNWTLIAAGLNTGLAPEVVEKMSPVLDAALQPLAAQIPYEAEPALVFELSPEDQP